MKPDETIKSWTTRAGVVRVRNALNPLLWMMALVVPTGWIAAYFFRDDLLMKFFFALLGAAPILATLTAYFIYMFRDPNRLQSEEHQLRTQALEFLGKKDAKSEIVEIVNQAPRLEIEKRSEGGDQ